jgi:endonuclease/exonuclease/phosphatase family metal-dependent hydrolase
MDRLRVVTLNLWNEQGPLARRMELIVDGLRALAPDVIGLQEVRQSAAVPNQAATIASALGMEHHFGVSTPWGGGEEGLALLSRHPIVARGERELPHATEKERRICVMITTETPAGPLHAYTTHLNYRATHGQIREDQLVAAEAFMGESPTVRLPKLLMGDFNATPDSDEIRWLRGLRSVAGRRVYFQDAWLRVHPSEPGCTWSSQNPYTNLMPWLERDRRLDYIFATSPNLDGSGLAIDARLALCSSAPGGVWPSDHFAVYAEISTAPV